MREDRGRTDERKDNIDQKEKSKEGERKRIT